MGNHILSEGRRKHVLLENVIGPSKNYVIVELIRPSQTVVSALVTLPVGVFDMKSVLVI